MKDSICAWLVISVIATPVFAHECLLKPMPIVQSTGAVGEVKVAFGDADNDKKPTAWQGPLTISVGSSPACTVSDEVSIVEKPIALGQGILFVPTYSGSTNMVYGIEVKTCRVLWHSSEFTGPVSYKDSILSLGSHHVQLNDKCRPIDTK